MIGKINKNEGLISLMGLVVAIVSYFFSDSKILAIIIIGLTLLIAWVLSQYENKMPKDFHDVQKIAKILFIDDKDCQIVTNLRRNNFEVRKIDDVLSLQKNDDVQWANIIFVDYKDIGKKLFGKKEGLGLINELKRVYKNKKYDKQYYGSDKS